MTMKTALTVNGKRDKQWHHEVVTLRDAVLRHCGTRCPDLALVNTDANDDIFSLIEVHRGEPEVPALCPPNGYQVVPNSKGAKYDKKGRKGERGGRPKRDRKNKQAVWNARTVIERSRIPTERSLQIDNYRWETRLSA